MSCKARVVTKTANYTAEERDYLILGNGASGDITISLPTAVGIRGQVFAIKNIHASNGVIIDPYSTETIDGASTITLALQYAAVILRSDGTNWRIEASYGFVEVDLTLNGDVFVFGSIGLAQGESITSALNVRALHMSSTSQTITGTSDQIDPGSAGETNYSHLLLAPTGSYTLVSTPQILEYDTNSRVLLLELLQGNSGSVVFSDESSVPGSKLQLGAATRTLSGNATLLLISNGTYWKEIAFSAN